MIFTPVKARFNPEIPIKSQLPANGKFKAHGYNESSGLRYSKSILFVDGEPVAIAVNNGWDDERISRVRKKQAEIVSLLLSSEYHSYSVEDWSGYDDWASNVEDLISW